MAKSVKLDMIPGDGVKTLTFKPTESVTVQAIMDLMVENKRDKYRFTEYEEGYRYWMYTLISDLEAEGILAQGSATTAWASISLY